MPIFLVQNLSDKDIRLGIEPWADLEVMAPEARVTFEYVEPAEIEFAVLPEGIVVSIVSDPYKGSGQGP